MSDSLRKFHNSLIENKEPIRSELGRQMAQWLAEGNTIHILPGPCGDRRIRDKPLEPMPKLIKRRRSDFIHNPWDSEAEIAKLRLLRTNGVGLAEIAYILSAEFGSDRNADSIKSALARDKNGTLGPNAIRLAWSGEEESWLRFLSKYGFTASEIAVAMNRFLGGRVRNRDSIRQYALGHKINQVAEPRRSRTKNG